MRAATSSRFLRSLLTGALLTVALAVRAAEPVQLWEEADLRLRPGAKAQVLIRLSIADGYALVGAGIRHATLRPLQLRMQPVEGVRFGAPSYPRPQPATLLADAAKIPAHAGVVAMRLPVSVPADAKWERTILRGVVRYQACRAGTCAPPRALPVAIELEIVRDRPAQ